MAQLLIPIQKSFVRHTIMTASRYHLDNYKNIISKLDEEDIINLMHPKPLSRLEVVFWDTHDRLQHMHPSKKLILCDHDFSIVKYTVFVNGDVKNGRYVCNHKYNWYLCVSE